METKVELTTICPLCHRQLRSPRSVNAGIGPVCAKKQKAAADQLALELQEDQEK